MDEIEPANRPVKVRKLTHSSTVESMTSANHEHSTGAENGQENTADLPDISSLLPTEPCTVEQQIAQDNHTEDVAQNQALGTKETPKLSKNALKKLRRKEEWEAGREDRKVKRKEKRHARQARKREEKKDKSEEKVEKSPPPQVPAVPIPMTFIIDAAFDSMMTDNEVISLASQISRSYNTVRNAQVRPLLAISSFNGRLRTRFDTLLAQQYKRWKGTHFREENVQEVGEQAQSWMKETPLVPSKEKNDDDPDVAKQVDDLRESKTPTLVYLSAESESILTDLSPYTSYVIGGLIDRNRHKGHCFKVAQEAGIATARLPIDEHINLSTRKVLTTNHVVEILIKYLETKDWARSFLEVIPARKGADVKENDNGTNLDGEEVEDDYAEAKPSKDELSQ